MFWGQADSKKTRRRLHFRAAAPAAVRKVRVGLAWDGP